MLHYVVVEWLCLVSRTLSIFQDKQNSFIYDKAKKIKCDNSLLLFNHNNQRIPIKTEESIKSKVCIDFWKFHVA